jgi:hypothetical protein
VVLALQFVSRLSCSLFCVVWAAPNLFSFDAYAGEPSTLALFPADASDSTYVCSLQVILVLHVDVWDNVSQIVDAVVQLVSVDMVNLICRPSAVHPQPRQPVSQVLLSAQSNDPISISFKASSNTAFNDITERLCPAQRACLWVVLNHASEVVRVDQ